MIGAMLARYAAYSPEAGLEAFNQALVALAEADLDGLDVRVDQHQVEDQVRKRHAAQRDAQAVHVGEVGLRRLAGLVDLGKDHLAARTVLSPPRGDLTMQRAQLTRLVATGMQFLQQPEQGRALQAPDRARVGWRSRASPQRTDSAGCDRCAAA